MAKTLSHSAYLPKFAALGLAIALLAAGSVALLFSGDIFWICLGAALVPVVALCGMAHFGLLASLRRFENDLVIALESADFTAASKSASDRVSERLHTFNEQLKSRNQKLADLCDNMAVGGAEVTFFVEQISKSSRADFANAEAVQSEVSFINQGSARSLETAQGAARSARLTHEASRSGQARVDETTTTIQQVADKVESTGVAIDRLRASSGQIQNIIGVISEVAEQTNLLALNAAIEAARAGEHGRGFAVVADEVRNLSRKTSQATSDISSVLKDIERDSEEASGIMVELNKSTRESVINSAEVSSNLREIGERAQESDAAVHDIVASLEQFSTAAAAIDTAISGVIESLDNARASTESTTRRSQELTEISEKLSLELSAIKLDGIQAEVLSEAQQASRLIGDAFESAIQRGELRLEDIFDQNYQAIPGTDPVKYHTRYDDFTDREFPLIQEPVLKKLPEVIYAGAVDRKGYFPTHNQKFSQSLTGDFETDLANNRGKRIFDDRTGSRCGNHTETFLLQTYMRDTGEVMHDLSVPIYVKGTHWGGFRVGYKARNTA